MCELSILNFHVITSDHPLPAIQPLNIYKITGDDTQKYIIESNN